MNSCASPLCPAFVWVMLPGKLGSLGDMSRRSFGSPSKMCIHISGCTKSPTKSLLVRWTSMQLEILLSFSSTLARSLSWSAGSSSVTGGVLVAIASTGFSTTYGFFRISMIASDVKVLLGSGYQFMACSLRSCCPLQYQALHGPRRLARSLLVHATRLPPVALALQACCFSCLVSMLMVKNRYTKQYAMW